MKLQRHIPGERSNGVKIVVWKYKKSENHGKRRERPWNWINTSAGTTTRLLRQLQNQIFQHTWPNVPWCLFTKHAIVQFIIFIEILTKALRLRTLKRFECDRWRKWSIPSVVASLYLEVIGCTWLQPFDDVLGLVANHSINDPVSIPLRYVRRVRYYVP